MFVLTLLRSAIMLAVASVGVACGTAPTHPALRSAQLPELVPVRKVVADVDYQGAFLLSPDGQRLLWSQPAGTDAGLAARDVALDDDLVSQPQRRFPTGHLARPANDFGNFTWLADSRHAVYLKDPSGAENTQIVVLDTESASFDPWVVTTHKARSFLLHAGNEGSARFLYLTNARDPASYDVFEADVVTRTVREVMRNDGSVRSWIPDRDGRIAARVRALAPHDGADQVVEVLRADAGEWLPVRRVGPFDVWYGLRMEAGTTAWPAVSNVGRDKLVLLNIDPATGTESLVFEHPEVDIRSVFTVPGSGVYGVLTEAGYPRFHYLDTPAGRTLQQAVQDALHRAQSRGLVGDDLVMVRPSTVSRDLRRVVLRAYTHSGVSELLFDRPSGIVLSLRRPREGVKLARVEPYSFAASDGMTLHGYVARPPGVTGPAPMVVNIHGGPWARDYWLGGELNTLQLLANRGYAVLQVNYRGSSGYGRRFMAAGAGKTATRLQQDVAEAVQWAIDQGIADPERLAVAGGSFGGFSTLMQLIDKPHPYRCGVNTVGVANWPRIFETWPPFWRNRHYFEWFYGRVDDPGERQAMWQGSPISRIDRITAPLLVIHGANDVRVVKQDSDDVVAALRDLGRPVDYLVFDNEGHSIRRWRNRIEYWRRVEDFLAACLGGRSAGFDYYELMPR